MLDVTIIVVTSPAPSNPSTDLITQSIESNSLVEGLSECPVIIVMDGFKVGTVNKPKMGRILEESAVRYELYHQAILAQFSGPRFRVVRNEVHQGFALSVKVGLELCETTYCMVTQYDRMFCAPFTRIGDLIQSMETNPYIRYIGFPSTTNTKHDKFITTNYNLKCLNTPEVKLSLGDHLYLQPTVFWYDSQHLGHVKRYLEIYRPYKNIPPHLRDIVGIFSIKDMLLRAGDFIEDRFGQVQRRLLWVLATRGTVTKEVMKGKVETLPVEEGSDGEGEGYGDGAASAEPDTMSNEGNNDTASSTAIDTLDATVTASNSAATATEINMDIVLELFRWYGTYLCWVNTSPHPYQIHNTDVHSTHSTLVMVRHLRGRQMTSQGVAWKLSGTYSPTAPSRGGFFSEEERERSRNAGKSDSANVDVIGNVDDSADMLGDASV